MTKQPGIFVSYHEDDQEYLRQFEKVFADQFNILASKPADIEAISLDLSTAKIRQKINKQHLKSSTVTVVLVGLETWRHKHIDWEIGSSLANTKAHPRSGLVGIFLPSHPFYRDYNSYNRYYRTIPLRLHYNIVCGYAKYYFWPGEADLVYAPDPITLSDVIQKAAGQRQQKPLPNNEHPPLEKARGGDKWF